MYVVMGSKIKSPLLHGGCEYVCFFVGCVYLCKKEKKVFGCLRVVIQEPGDVSAYQIS